MRILHVIPNYQESFLDSKVARAINNISFNRCRKWYRCLDVRSTIQNSFLFPQFEPNMMSYRLFV